MSLDVNLINTNWKIVGELPYAQTDALAITLLDEGFFEFIKILDGKQKTYGEAPDGGADSKYTWNIDGNNINLSFRDFTFLKGQINFESMTMEGKKIDKYDRDQGEWTAVEIDLENFMTDSNAKHKKELEETETISAKEIVQAIWNTYGQPDGGDTPKLSLLNYKYETKVKHKEADYIANNGLGCKRLDKINDDADSHNPEGMETIEISVWDYIIDNFEKDFTSKVNTSTLMDYLELGMQPKEDIEEIINIMMNNLCDVFSGFSIMGGEVLYPELGDNPWENPETIYLEVSVQELFLEDLNPKWSEDKFILTE